MEVWLKTNRRALALGLVVPVALAVGGVLGLAWAGRSGQHWLVQLVALVIAAVGLWMIGELAYAMTRPRVAYEAGDLLVYLEPARPTRVPIEIVEVFFLGQGPGGLPKLKGKEPETQNVIIRLAESASEWKHRDVKPAFGHWCGGYITIRGSWCEPITHEVMRRMNRRLAEVKTAGASSQGSEVGNQRSEVGGQKL
jgi:hypothetical protein